MIYDGVQNIPDSEYFKHYKGIVYRKFDSARFFGVELEVSNTVSLQKIQSIIELVSPRRVLITDWRQTFNNRYWHLKTDATCGPTANECGYEIVSYKASGYEDVVAIGNIADFLRYSDVKVNSNCGLHVHVDLSDFTVEQVGVLLASWLKIELLMLNAVPERRQENAFCVPLSCTKVIYDGEYDPVVLWDIFKPKNYEDRRVALNLFNYATGLKRKRWSRKTVELRLPEGTLLGRDVKNWIRLFVNFVETSKNKPMPTSLTPLGLVDSMKYIGLWHDDYFVIFSEGLLDTRVWFLERITKFSKDKLLAAQARELLSVIREPLKSLKS